ncbi:hypothetical protein M569_03316, partial [Genlisea aurea]
TSVFCFLEMVAAKLVVAAILLAVVAVVKGGSVVKGSVSCADCKPGSDLSGIQVLMKCDGVKKLSMAYTDTRGRFQADLPSDAAPPPPSSNCMAKIMGGPYQLYVKASEASVPVSRTQRRAGVFAVSKPMSFVRDCPAGGNCGAKDAGFVSSDTVGLPLPKEWGLAPSSYYIPFVPIIGIP